MNVICPAFKMAQYAVAVIRHAVDVLFHFRNGTGVEIIFLIQHTKFAFIPGAVLRHTQKQAVFTQLMQRVCPCFISMVTFPKKCVILSAKMRRKLFLTPPHQAVSSQMSAHY